MVKEVAAVYSRNKTSSKDVSSIVIDYDLTIILKMRFLKMVLSEMMGIIMLLLMMVARLIKRMMMVMFL